MMKNILVISLPLEVSKATVSRPLSLCGDDDNLLQLTQGYLTEKPVKDSINEMTLVNALIKNICSSRRNSRKLHQPPIFMVYRFFYHTKFDGVFEPSDSVTYTYNNEIPDLTPSGKYKLKFEFYEKTKGRVACANIRFKL